MFHLVVYKKASGEIRRVITRTKQTDLRLTDLGLSPVLYDTLRVVSSLGSINPTEWMVEKGTLIKIKEQAPLVLNPTDNALEGKKTKLVFIGDKLTDNTGFGTQYSILAEGLRRRGYEIQQVGYPEINKLLDMSFDYVLALSDFNSVKTLLDLNLKNVLYWFALESANWPEDWNATLKTVPHIVPLLPFGQSALSAKGLSTHEAIPHGVPLDTLRPIPLRQRAVLRREQKVDSNFVVSYLGTNVQRKCIDALIESYAKFVKKYDDAGRSLLLLKTKLKGHYDIPALIKKAADTHGVPALDRMIRVIDRELDRVQLNDFINISDLGFNATSGEGFCVPIIEYLACGIPFLMGNHTSAPDLLSQFPLVDIESTYADDRFRWSRYKINTNHAADCLGEYLNRWKQNQAYSKQTLRDYASRFSAQRMVDAWDVLIQDLEQERLDKQYLNKASTIIELSEKVDENARFFEIGQERLKSIDTPENDTPGVPGVKWVAVT